MNEHVSSDGNVTSVSLGKLKLSFSMVTYEFYYLSFKSNTKYSNPESLH